ncbi:GAF domain-containing protein [Streptomyces sp. NPDC059816]|uniref:GAF domain-containing protein n=1 Tax=Streptomyces sp. NPDC059816 TaxID=3346960 RepID=UPI003657D471
MPADIDPRTGQAHLRALNDGTPLREARLTALGLDPTAVYPAFDAFAAELAARLQMPYAMFNLIGRRQVFVGLFAASHDEDGHPLPPVGRTMDLEHGFCPAVVDRRKALPLPDVCASSRFAGNPVVDRIGIRAYAGAPLIDPTSGEPIGTVCGVDVRPHSMERGRYLLDTVNAAARTALALLLEHPARPLTGDGPQPVPLSDHRRDTGVLLDGGRPQPVSRELP